MRMGRAHRSTQRARDITTSEMSRRLGGARQQPCGGRTSEGAALPGGCASSRGLAAASCASRPSSRSGEQISPSSWPTPPARRFFLLHPRGTERGAASAKHSTGHGPSFSGRLRAVRERAASCDEAPLRLAGEHGEAMCRPTTSRRPYSPSCVSSRARRHWWRRTTPSPACSTPSGWCERWTRTLSRGPSCPTTVTPSLHPGPTCLLPPEEDACGSSESKRTRPRGTRAT